MERKITIEESVPYTEDYQNKMLEENQVEGLLEMHGRGMDDKSCYDYDVSGKVSMKALYEKHTMSGEEIKILLKSILRVVKEVERYLLNVNCILMDPEYIFYKEEKYYFCYYPPKEKSLWEGFHHLSEYLVKCADYQDKECVQIVFLLHKETMKENYSLEQIIKECVKEEEENDILDSIKGIILLSLIDIPKTLEIYLGENFNSYLRLAEEKEQEGKVKDLMPKEAFIHPISVKTFLRYAKYNKDIDFAGYGRDNKLEKLNNIDIPLFMRWGNDKEMIIQKADELVSLVNNIIINDKKDIDYIDGSNHSYDGKEELVAKQIIEFINK